MKTIQFETELKRRGVLDVPADVANELPVPGHARVIVILGETEEDGWRQLTYDQFLRSYAEEDAIYDEYDEHRAG